MVRLNIDALVSRFIEKYLILGAGNERGIDIRFFLQMNHISYTPGEQRTGNHMLARRISLFHSLLKQPFQPRSYFWPNFACLFVTIDG